MDNIRKSIEILFKKEDPDRILKDYFSLKSINHTNEIDKEYFQSLFSSENPLHYNDDEIENVVDIMESNWMKKSENKEKSIFNILVGFTNEVLKEVDGEPQCRYEKLLKWRELSYQLGEDIFTTSNFAYNDLISTRKRNMFSWKPIISTDNHSLKELFKKGMAENHFHLKGSAPHFQLSWVSLMNEPFEREKEFKRLNQEFRRSPSQNYLFNSQKSSLELLVKKAAYIRYTLFNILKGKQDIKLKKILLSETSEEFNLEAIELKDDILSTKYEFGKRIGRYVPDYMISKNISSSNYNKENKNYNGNVLLYGERKFLYECFKEIYRGRHSKLDNYKDLFYVYLIIKQQFRGEIIQVNKRVGFNNFAKYQDRKSYFITKESIFENAIINMAVNSSIYDQNIDSLEARIGPEDSVAEYNETILKIDRAIEDEIFFENDILKDCEAKINAEDKTKEEKKYFYNVHFIKNQEKYKNYKSSDLSLDIKCRNHNVRVNIEVQAKELNDLRKSSFESSKRILGIDAANFEIGCRPEVFAQVFRFLKKYSYYNELEIFDKDSFNKLGLTFHVGEDFLDITSGLRAIDEAIKFLELEQGDRLGHALALGIDVEDYYRSKNYKMILPKHDLLDNYAWLLAKIREYNLNPPSNLIFELEKGFKFLYNEIYDGNIVSKNINICHNTYYEAWKLRGDNPNYYIEGKFDKKNPLSFWERSGIREGVELKQLRGNEVYVKLYCNYHFNSKIKINGSMSTEMKITTEYINTIMKLQKAMQYKIRRKNIYIETNPSSNYVIGNFKRYSKHPLVNFFNLGLTYNLKELSECSQLPISINTDDQGVFATYLENEYALMALSLEKEKDANGNFKYNPTMIYEWLDKIRQFGLEQSFSRRRKK